MEQECCPVILKDDWDFKRHEWGRRAFYRQKYYQLFHIPIGIGKAFQEGFKETKEKGYVIPPPHIILCEETGLLTAQLLMSIDQIPQNDPNVVVWEPAVMYTKYYQGPFRGIKSQVDTLVDYVNNQKQKVAKLYTWVTNCPKCWEKQGGPTTIILARVI